MSLRHETMQALNDVVAEHDAARKAIAFLLKNAERDQTLLERGERADLRTCLQNLERTYLVRLFALFEETLRDIWERAFGRTTEPRAKELLDACAVRQRVAPDDIMRAVHEVRGYRNFVVHGAPAPVVALADAKSRLCRFLGWMPESW